MIMALGITGTRFSSLGTESFSCLVGGVSIFTGIGFGMAMLILCGIILLGMFIFDKRKIGIGTILSMIIVGYGSDFFMYFFQKIVISSDYILFIRIIALISGIIIFCFGVAMYIEANLGVSPYDSVALIISEKTKKEKWFRWIRIITDSICVFTGFLLGNIPGIGTIIMALFAGPLIAFFRKKNTILFYRNNENTIDDIDKYVPEKL
jgi:uncharacterized membrane protein YczE